MFRSLSWHFRRTSDNTGLNATLLICMWLGRCVNPNTLYETFGLVDKEHIFRLSYLSRCYISKSKNKYIGKWTETGWKTIDLPYSPSNLLFLFDLASKAESGDYNHQDIANWCLQYWQKYYQDDDKELDSLDKVAVQLASEVDAQWDLYLTNTYSLDQLKNLDFASVNLPLEWFEQWARVLSRYLVR